VSTPASEYVRGTRRIAVRWRNKNRQWDYAVVRSTMTAREVIEETDQPLSQVLSHQAVTLAYVRFYDQRAGGVETAIKDDKQGLGLTKRNKKRCEAQQMVMLLATLAHNVIVWARRALAPDQPKLRYYGLKRMVRDSFDISGRIVRNAHGRIVEIVLNQAAPMVGGLTGSFDVLLRPKHIAVSWGQI
jgi:hypothetical protein